MYIALISMIVYPISGHWIWGGGWLASLGFHDFAGSTAVHMVGGITACIGAASVHGVCGAFGTLCVGLFDTERGLFYGGGFAYLATQLLGVLSVAVWVIVTMTVIFFVIDKLIGLRVPAQVEIDGLDIHEHGLASAYSGFAITDVPMAMEVNENTDLGVTGMTVTQVMGCGIRKGAGEFYRGVEMDAMLLPKIKVEIVVSRIPVDSVIETAKKALYTGHVGDGKIFVYDVRRVVKVRTGEEDFAALQDVE